MISPYRVATVVATVLAGVALGRLDYVQLWKNLPADSALEEVIRNFFVRQPSLRINICVPAGSDPLILKPSAQTQKSAGQLNQLTPALLIP